MSHQLCQSCGSNQFEHIDGRLYCVICQSQNVSIQHHVSFANEGNAQLGRRVGEQMSSSILDETIPKIEIIESMDQKSHLIDEVQESLSRSSDQQSVDQDQSRAKEPAWSTAELYSYILHIQLETIIKLSGMKKDKQDEFRECSLYLYLRYLSANGLLETNETRVLQRQEERRKKMIFLSKELYHERRTRSERGELPLLQKDSRCLNLDVLLGLIHCSSTLVHQPILLRQLIRWINREQLPYYNIRTFLPNSIVLTGRDRFNLEKMKIHSENFFVIYHQSLRPIIKSYLSRCIFQSEKHFNDLLERFCENFCSEIYFPYDNQTRPLFQSLCRRIVQMKSNHRHFLSTSLDFELTALVLVFIVITIRSINDPLLDQFLQHQRFNVFSYSLWLNNLNALIHLESIVDYQFYGRTSILIDSTTDSRSKRRFISSLSKVFDRRIQTNDHESSKIIDDEMKRIREILIKNSQSGSLSYAMKSEEFFLNQFSHLSSTSLPSLLETMVHNVSPPSFSLVDKSELYETCLALINGGVTITQIEHFYLLYQRFHFASTSNYSIQHLLSTLTHFSSIPYNEDFHSFVSRFLKIVCLHHRLDHYFYHQSTMTRRIDLSETRNPIGLKRYGIDLLPIIYDLSIEQERPQIKIEPLETSVKFE